MRQFFAAAAAFLMAAGAAQAHAYDLGDLHIDHPHARVVIASRPAAAYFTVHNKGEADRLVSVSTPAFARAELHTHKMEGDVMRMLQVEAIDVPAGGMAALKSGGDHVMLFDAASEWKVGDEFPMTLTFEKAGAVEVVVKVEPIAASGGDHAGHGDHGGHGEHAGHGDHSGHGKKAGDAGHGGHGGHSH